MASGKLKKFNFSLKGTKVPPKYFGEAGKFVENLLIAKGLPLQKGVGADLRLYGLEVKTRDLDSTSAQTIGTMHPDLIKNTAYTDSLIKEKFQQQYRVYTKDQIIVEDRIVDFSNPTIQKLIEGAYETARSAIINGTVSDYVAGTYWGYFERTHKSESYSFRMSSRALERLEGLAHSTFNNLFEEL
jgi:hypothetical protein